MDSFNPIRHHGVEKAPPSPGYPRPLISLLNLAQGAYATLIYRHCEFISIVVVKFGETGLMQFSVLRLEAQ